MDLQAIYESISNFWNEISPILIAHVVLLIAWFWIKKSKINILAPIERLLESETYKRWKKILDEFQLRPTIPFLFIFLAIVYFVVLGNILDFLVGGFFSPLSLVHNEADFWLETNDRNVFYQIVDVGAYQNVENPDIDEIVQFKTKKLEEFKAKYPDRYDSLISWRIQDTKKWNQYYQLSVVGFLVISLLLIPKINRSILRLSMRRVYAALLISLILIFWTRYNAEQTIEGLLNSQLTFVASILREDATAAELRLFELRRHDLLCKLYFDKQEEAEEIQSDGDTRRFWLSRYLEPPLQREFSTQSTSEITAECDTNS